MTIEDLLNLVFFGSVEILNKYLNFPLEIKAL